MQRKILDCRITEIMLIEENAVVNVVFSKSYVFDRCISDCTDMMEPLSHVPKIKEIELDWSQTRLVIQSPGIGWKLAATFSWWWLRALKWRWKLNHVSADNFPVSLFFTLIPCWGNFLHILPRKEWQSALSHYSTLWALLPDILKTHT